MSTLSFRRAPAGLVVALFLTLVPFVAAQSTGSGTTGSGTTGAGSSTGSGTTSGPTLGYDPLTNGTAPTVNTFQVFTGGAATAFIVPFQVNSLGGHFSLASVSLLISGIGGQISNLSVSVSDTLPTSSTPPTSLATFSNSLTGWPGSDSTAYPFRANQSPTLDAGTTYYLRIGYDGTNTINWDKTSSAGFGSGVTPALNYITGTLSAGTLITYRKVTAGGFTDLYDNIGGFSITANAVSAIPEPAAFAALAAGAALLAGLIVRRCRRRTPVPASLDTGS